ncbi:MAG: sarcosine oxidase subunit gamma [Paracoccaceae bacterium]
MPYEATFDRLATQALFDLKGPARQLRDWVGELLPEFPEQANSGTMTGGKALYYIGLDHWLLRAELPEEQALIAELRPADAPPDISIVQISDTQAYFRITGSQADEVLAIGCPMNLHAREFGTGAASFTEFFGLRALVTRCDSGFDVAVEQSFGPMIEDYLNRALR